MSNVSNGHIARKQRQEDAADRLAGGTPAPDNQIRILDERLGEGVGASKERARLAYEMNKGKKK